MSVIRRWVVRRRIRRTSQQALADITLPPRGHLGQPIEPIEVPALPRPPYVPAPGYETPTPPPAPAAEPAPTVTDLAPDIEVHQPGPSENPDGADQQRCGFCPRNAGWPISERAMLAISP